MKRYKDIKWPAIWKLINSRTKKGLQVPDSGQDASQSITCHLLSHLKHQSVPEASLLCGKGQNHSSKTFAQALGQQMYTEHFSPSLCQAVRYVLEIHWLTKRDPVPILRHAWWEEDLNCPWSITIKCCEYSAWPFLKRSETIYQDSFALEKRKYHNPRGVTEWWILAIPNS